MSLTPSFGITVGSNLYSCRGFRPLNPECAAALRDFWSTLPAHARNVLDAHVKMVADGTGRVGSSVPGYRAAVALSALWGAMDALNVAPMWHAFAGEVHWIRLASGLPTDAASMAAARVKYDRDRAAYDASHA